MKKAQILSAIALAFALGVIAPVAGLVSNASAYSETKGTATYSDVNNAISYVENNAQYKAYGQIQDALRTYNGNTSQKYTDLAAVSGVENNAGAILVKMNAAQTVNNAFGYDMTQANRDIANTTDYAKQIKVAKNLANGSTLYKDIAAIVEILNNGTSADDAKLQAAVQTFRVHAGPENLGLLNNTEYSNLHPEQATVVKYRANNAIEAISASLTSIWDAAEAIYNAIDNADEALAKFEAGYKLFMPLLSNSGLLDQAAKDYLQNTENIQPSNLWYLATNNIVRNAAWANLYEGVKVAKEQRVLDESGDNFTVIRNLALQWQTATGNEEKTSVVMARMVAYKAPVNSGDNNDSTTIPGVGDTGVISAAEGTASTTVSIVAGLATALTALGAGVVAYRNARRSSEN